jgi:integrase
VLKLLLLTGCRLNEIGCLEWSEVSDDCSTITLPGDRVKNHRPFVIPLPPMAQAILADRPREGRYVFSTTGGTAPINGWGRAKVKVDAASGVKDYRFHDLRRTCATGMAEIGVAPHIVEACLNHASGHKAGVAGIYNRAAYGPEKTAALKLWADHVYSIVQAEDAPNS